MARTVDPEWATMYFTAAEALQERDWRAAAAAYKALHQLESENELYIGSLVEKRLLRGLAHHLAGDYALAIGEFSAVRERWSRSLEPVLLLAEAFFLTGEEEHAEATLHEFYDMTDLKDATALGAAALYNYVEDYDKGRAWAERIQDVSLRDRTLIVFLVKFDPFEVIELGEAALQRNPKDPRIMSHLRWAYLDTEGLSEKSEALYRKAIELDDEEVLAHFSRGIQMRQRGNKIQFQQYLPIASARKPP